MYDDQLKNDGDNIHLFIYLKKLAIVFGLDLSLGKVCQSLVNFSGELIRTMNIRMTLKMVMTKTMPW